jgi:fructokinase
VIGAVEAGGTKWLLAIGAGHDEILAETMIPTTSPAETLKRALEFFTSQPAPPTAIGIGSFGPVDLNPSSPTWGSITNTPKPGWADVDVAGPFLRATRAAVAFDTDVNAAALGEHRWGAGRGLKSIVYITVGTGIGLGAIVDDRPLRGLVHPEFGHIRIPHDQARDPYDGSCPFHGDCLEGLASGAAIAGRRKKSGLAKDDQALWDLIADYISAGLVNAALTLSPERIIVGGGVLQQVGLLAAVRSRFNTLLGGYVDLDAHVGSVDDYIVAPGLGERSGLLGALALGQDAARSKEEFQFQS